MAVSLIGEVVNSADATTGYNVGNISGDDDKVEGTGAIGVKASSTTQAMFTTSLGASAPYDFSSGGGEFGYHIIMWFNTKTPVAASGGLRIYVGDSAGGPDAAHWYVDPAGFYKGGFITAVVDTARDFDTITAGSWSTTGNPGQLTNVNEMGGVFNTTTTIMGSFNNVQLDQFTIGLGLRVDAGTVGSPNSFETVRSADESTNFWGWWSSKNGAFVGKGKLYIGPASGLATSVFTDSAFSLVFADERVATGFYEINTRGGGTDVTWTLANISAANPSNARWNLTVQSDTNSFADTDGVWSGADQLVLDNSVTLTRTTMVDCNKVTQNGATLDGCTILAANTADGTAFIASDAPNLISDCSFTFSDGHAIEITQTGTYSFVGNIFTGYGSAGSNDAAIYNNSGGAVTLNISGGGTTPTVRNGAGASTTVNNNISVTFTGLKDNTEVRIYSAGTTTELDGVENATAGTPDDRSVTFSLAGSTSVDIRFMNLAWIVPPNNAILGFTWPTADVTDFPITQIVDRTYENP